MLDTIEVHRKQNNISCHQTPLIKPGRHVAMSSQKVEQRLHKDLNRAAEEASRLLYESRNK